MQLLGTYAGIVENVKDPQRLGRVKARVPHVHGVSGSGAGYIGTNDLPWALPSGMPAGGGPASGGFSQLPAVGDKVWVRFTVPEAMTFAASTGILTVFVGILSSSSVSDN